MAYPISDNHDILQRLLDDEARLKNENKLLRMQVAALEERTDSLENEISSLKQSLKTNISQHSRKRLPPKPRHNPPNQNAPPPTDKKTRHTTPGGVSNESGSELPFRIVWGTQYNCTSAVVHKAISPMLTQAESQLVVVKSPSNAHMGRVNGGSPL